MSNNVNFGVKLQTNANVKKAETKTATASNPQITFESKDAFVKTNTEKAK